MNTKFLLAIVSLSLAAVAHADTAQQRDPARFYGNIGCMVHYANPDERCMQEVVEGIIGHSSFEDDVLRAASRSRTLQSNMDGLQAEIADIVRRARSVHAEFTGPLNKHGIGDCQTKGIGVYRDYAAMRDAAMQAAAGRENAVSALEAVATRRANRNR